MDGREMSAQDGWDEYLQSLQKLIFIDIIHPLKGFIFFFYIYIYLTFQGCSLSLKMFELLFYNHQIY